MDKEEILQKIARDNVSTILPLAIYLVDLEGNFIDCNQRFLKLFNLPRDRRISGNIKQFYQFPEERERIKIRFQKEETNTLEDQLIAMKVENEQRWIKDSCIQIWDENHTIIIGYLGCMVDITDEEKFRDQAPVGMYELDENDFIIRINKSVADSLSYEINELLGQHVRKIYEREEDINEFREDLIKNADSKKLGIGIITKRKVELRAKMGGKKIFWANAVKKPLMGKEYKGRTGILIDITHEEEMQLLLDLIPIGAYRIRYENEGQQQIIEDCNNHFASMFGFASISEAKGKDVTLLWQNFKEDSVIYEKDLEDKETVGQSAACVIGVKTYNGTREFQAEIHGRLHKKGGKTIGRVGAIRDVTKDISLIEMKKDIGKVLHEYQANINLFKYIVSQVISLLLDELPNEPEFTNQMELSKILIPSIKNLENEICMFVNYIDEEPGRADVFPIETYKRIKTIQSVLKNFTSSIPSEQWDSTAHVICLELKNIFENIEKRIIAKGYSKAVLNKTKITAKLSAAILLNQVKLKLYEADIHVKQLRDKVLNPEKIVYSLKNKTICLLTYLVSKAIENIGLYPIIKGVDIKKNYRQTDVKVLVDENEMVTAFYNLLHNAIKYSWSRIGDQKPWVVIRVDTKDNIAHISFQNYGVPIKRNEIQSGLIFNEGLRGSESVDRGRTGMGLGLSLARDIVRKHGGDIKIQSNAADFRAKEEDYSVPFLTTATVFLPIYYDK